MDIQKAIEIADLNLKENPKKMPPDVQTALIILIRCARFALVFKEAYDLYTKTTTPTDPQ